MAKTTKQVKTHLDTGKILRKGFDFWTACGKVLWYMGDNQTNNPKYVRCKSCKKTKLFKELKTKKKKTTSNFKKLWCNRCMNYHAHKWVPYFKDEVWPGMYECTICDFPYYSR